MTEMPQWSGTGAMHQIASEFDRVPPFDPRAGDHLWTIATLYRWGGPDVETPMLDSETLLQIVGPGCYYCEMSYTPLVATRRCPGRPR